jgi:hypothetical protein
MKKDEVGKSDSLYEVENLFEFLYFGYVSWTYSQCDFNKDLLRLCLGPLVYYLSSCKDELREGQWNFLRRVREEVFDSEV